MGLNCPRCSTGTLEGLELGDVLIDRCVVCAGLWFDQGEIEQLVGESDRIRKMEAEVPAAEGSIYCPRCAGIRLRPVLLGRPDGSEVYAFRCASCMGTWLDRGVLRREEDPQIAASARRCIQSLLDISR